MDTQPDDQDTPDRTDTNAQDVQPTHEPIVEPYDGPTDSASVIQAVIAGQLTTRDAADLLSTSTGSIRKLASRERARQARQHARETDRSQHARTQSPGLSRIVSPPIIDIEDADADDQTIDPEQVNPETPSETSDPSADVASLQFDERDTQTGGETGQGETPSADRDTSKAETFHQGTANLQNNTLPKSRKVTNRLKADEGYFERDELDTLDNLHRIITRNAKRAESGKDCQGWTASLAIVLDLRRRAAGKSCTLVKETVKASNTRNSIVFIGNAQASPASQPSLKLAKSKVIDLPAEPQTLSASPPALDTAINAAPSYVRGL